MGPDRGYVMFLFAVIIAAFVCIAVFIPITSCPPTAAGCLPAVVNPNLGPAVGVPVTRGCPCNASTVIRNATNARVISNNVLAASPTTATDPRGTSALNMAFLQFFANDMFAPNPAPGTNYDIPVAPTDPFFGPLGITFIPTGLMPTTTLVSSCPNPVNQATPFIDLSNIYGTDLTFLNTRLRSQNGRGLMNLTASLPDGGKDDTDGTINWMLPYDAGTKSFVVADTRDLLTTGLIALHTLAVRNHNYWAIRLAGYQPTWTDDQLFWKARQLNIADWQVIVYNQWLPAILGDLAPVVSSLTYSSTEVSQPYVEVLSTAIPAMEDTMAPPSYGNPKDGPSGQTPFIDTIGQATSTTAILQYGIDPTLYDLAYTPLRKFDTYVETPLRNIVFNGTNGFDIPAVDIQTARYLRVPDWSAIYTCFGSTPIVGDDSDPLVGFVQEAIYPGTSSGLTLGNLLAGQFTRTARSDPNFYLFSQQEIGKIFWNTILQSNMGLMIARNSQLRVSSQNPFFS